MNLITVDHDNCTKCGNCVNECPSDVLALELNGPEVVLSQNCIACGHCVAVCPKSAIDNLRSPLKEQVEISKFKISSPHEAEFFLRYRRSIRTYKTEPVPKEKLLKLVEIANYAPTGSNTQGISYLIVDDKDVLKKASDITIDYLEKSPSVRPALRKILTPLIEKYHETGSDSVLRGAPALVVAMADKNFIQGRGNTISCLTYLELFAPHLDLGSCWAGLFEHCALNENSPILKLLKIPEDKLITGAVMVGYPKYKYQRLVERNPVEVKFLS
jgi:nitroreductase/NAD-dependent dihydropyrimidine dehydrogenase PreA subunit